METPSPAGTLVAAYMRTELLVQDKISGIHDEMKERNKTIGLADHVLEEILKQTKIGEEKPCLDFTDCLEMRDTLDKLAKAGIVEKGKYVFTGREEIAALEHALNTGKQKLIDENQFSLTEMQRFDFLTKLVELVAGLIKKEEESNCRWIGRNGR